MKLKEIYKFITEVEDLEQSKLRHILLSIGGKVVSFGRDSEDELLAMTSRGEDYSSRKVKRYNLPQSQCHRNIANLYKKLSRNRIKIINGYALADDSTNSETWVSHTWGYDEKNDMIIDGRYEYKKYYGFELNESESEDFVFYNL